MAKPMASENTLIRSAECAECGAEMLWTQNAWPADDRTEAAYRCVNAHVVDPATTRQCPKCGVHDTELLASVGGQERFRCFRCGQSFDYPR
jgi:DNA-directed RNA polymerase subunit RPC12/RpoP